VTHPDQRERDHEALQERLTRLSEASLRINESLDFDEVLQGVLDAARSLTAARYGVMTLLDDAGGVRDFLASGLSAEQAGLLRLTLDGVVGARTPSAARRKLGEEAANPGVPLRRAPVGYRMPSPDPIPEARGRRALVLGPRSVPDAVHDR